MITKLVLNKVSSYRQPAVLETDKRVNLIYGLNGTGKSTISNYFYNPTDPRYSNCSHDAGNDFEFVVYNQTFVDETFYQANDLPGIFTLSKENKDARTAIEKATNELLQLENELVTTQTELDAANLAVSNTFNEAKDQIWQIKTKYSGGDRVLDFCLEGYKGSSDKFFTALRDHPKPVEKPPRTLQEIEAETKSITGDATRLSLLPKLIFDGHAIESDTLFSDAIIGSNNSTVAAVINRLDNSDWVRQGLEYLPEKLGKSNSICPFCQEATISGEFRETLTKYFDDEFEKQLSRLNSYSAYYSELIESLPDLSVYTSHSRLSNDSEIFKSIFSELQSLLGSNKRFIDEKIVKPSKTVSLADTSTLIARLNKLIDKANEDVKAHNQKIDDAAGFKQSAKEEFWDVIRWEYDHVFEKYNLDKSACENRVKSARAELEAVKEKIEKKQSFIAEKQKSTVNVDQAVQQINATLSDLGMHGFSIAKKDGDGTLYRLIRQGQEESIFTSLSEGEKMMISFLYFLELCRGKSSATAITRKKIVVIDDPISSLSHIFVFNVGRLIYMEFLRGDRYEQVFVFTHNLYFFHELTDINKERRERDQSLFRLFKNSNGSKITPMKYEEIQNDYHTYWAVIKDEEQPGALIANCMRNVVEYFFGFVEKRDLNAVFTKPELQQVRFQAFHRYINRESHSLPQNIFDQKEFDYNDFKDAFELVFKLTGYEKHYAKMIR